MRYRENIIYDETSNIIIRTFFSDIPRGKRPYREHHHTSCEMSILLSGNGIYNIQGREYRLERGDVILLGSDEAHYMPEAFERIELFNIQFEPRLLWENSESIEMMKLFLARNENFRNAFHNDQKLSSFIHAIKEESNHKNPGFEIMTKFNLFSALIHILRSYDYVTASPIREFSSAERLKEAMTYINENIDTKLSLKDIADVACLSQTYFSALFKKLNGLSPWDYIMIKRVERAIDMLKNTDMTKLEIAEKCGFTSSSNFYKVFYNITGKRPSDYERKIT